MSLTIKTREWRRKWNHRVICWLFPWSKIIEKLEEREDWAFRFTNTYLVSTKSTLCLPYSSIDYCLALCIVRTQYSRTYSLRVRFRLCRSIFFELGWIKLRVEKAIVKNGRSITHKRNTEECLMLRLDRKRGAENVHVDLSWWLWGGGEWKVESKESSICFPLHFT